MIFPWKRGFKIKLTGVQKKQQVKIHKEQLGMHKVV